MMRKRSCVPDDRTGIVGRRDAEHEAAAVDLNELGLSRDVHTDGGRRVVRDVKLRADAALAVLQSVAMALQAAFSSGRSYTASRTTGREPEPTAAAVFSGVTTVEAVPTAPNGNGHWKSLLYYVCEPPATPDVCVFVNRG